MANPKDEQLARAVLCAAALVCSGDRESMSAALLGALVENACGFKNPGGVLEALIESLDDAAKLVASRVVHRPAAVQA